MITITPPEMISNNANIGEPGCSNTKDTSIKHRANHSGVMLFLSIHTHKHRANDSSVILLESRSERTDLPISIK